MRWPRRGPALPAPDAPAQGDRGCWVYSVRLLLAQPDGRIWANWLDWPYYGGRDGWSAPLLELSLGILCSGAREQGADLSNGVLECVPYWVEFGEDDCPDEGGGMLIEELLDDSTLKWLEKKGKR